MQELSTIGIDLVAMSVNDLLCSGAKPVAFLDYLAVGKLEKDRAANIIQGVLEGCKQANCRLIGELFYGMFVQFEFELDCFYARWGNCGNAGTLRSRSL